MRTFELRVYKLRTKEALDFYRKQIYPSIASSRSHPAGEVRKKFHAAFDNQEDVGTGSPSQNSISSEQRAAVLLLAAPGCQ